MLRHINYPCGMVVCAGLRERKKKSKLPSVGRKIRRLSRFRAIFDDNQFRKSANRTNLCAKVA